VALYDDPNEGVSQADPKDPRQLANREFKLSRQPEVIGFNNFAKLNFSADTTLEAKERISHELFWLTHDTFSKPEEVLASTIHGYVPRALSFRQEIVRVAWVEHGRWNPAGLPFIVETDSLGTAMIDSYHNLLRSENEALKPMTPANETHIGFYGARGGHETGNILDWSAVFISYVMKIAGAGAAFLYSPRHIDYVRRAKFNRSHTSNPFQLFNIAEAEPEPGDLVVKWRAPAFSYADIETTDTYSGRFAHVDIVVSKQQASIKVIGGNLSQTVRELPYDLDAGKLRASDDFVAILKIGGAP
jgi:hypothetical protein